jgi:hypothetical protein
MQDTIDLNDLVIGKDVDEVKEMMRDNYGDEIGDEICIFLESHNLFEWIRVLNESQNDVLDSESFIGTKDLELESILNFRGVLKILSDSDDVSWRDPGNFSVYTYSALAESIDSKFDSDKEYIEYMEENTNEDVEELYEVYDNLYNNKDEMTIVNMFASGDDYDLEFSELYSSVSEMYSLTAADKSEWDSDPNVSDYAVFSATKDDGTGGKVLLRIKDIEVEELKYSDVSDEPVEDDFVLDTRKNLVFENVAHEDEVSEAYSDHFLLQDTMETNKLSPRHENSLEFYEENPLPF